MTKNAIRVSIGLLILLFVGGALSSCGSMNMKWAQPQRTLSSGYVKRINTARVHNIVVQNELEPAHMTIVGAPFIVGALPAALIAAHERAKADEARTLALEKMRPLQDAVRDVDFRKMVNERVLPKVTATNWLRISKITHLNQDVSINQFKTELQSGSEDTVVTLHTSYQLLPKFTSLSLSSVVKVWLKSEKNTPIYIGTFEYQSLPVVAEPIASEDAEDKVATEAIASKALAKWMESNQAAYRYAISQGIREIAAMIRYELDERGGVADFGNEKVRLPYSTSGEEGRVNLDAKVIRKSGNRYWIRANRIMVSLGKDGLLMGARETGEYVAAVRTK